MVEQSSTIHGGDMKVEFKHWHQILELATKQIGKPSVYISNGLEFITPKDESIWRFVQDEVQKLHGIEYNGDVSVLTVDYRNTMSNILQGGLFFFETEEEQYKFYKIFEQELTDSSAIYACTFDRNGKCKTENT